MGYVFKNDFYLSKWEGTFCQLADSKDVELKEYLWYIERK